MKYICFKPSCQYLCMSVGLTKWKVVGFVLNMTSMSDLQLNLASFPILLVPMGSLTFSVGGCTKIGGPLGVPPPIFEPLTPQNT